MKGRLGEQCCEDGQKERKEETQGGQEGAEQGREGRRRARRTARMQARKKQSIFETTVPMVKNKKAKF